MLTQDQEKAKQELLGFLISSEKYFVLSGFAGVGKTFLIQHVQYAYHQYISQMNKVTGGSKPHQWIYTATTNKAVQSLRCAVQGEDVRTLHSLLGLRVRSDYKTGATFTVQDKSADVIEQSIVVIDEANFVDYQMLGFIEKSIINNSKVIFMGDPTQLTPVGLNHSPVFKQTQYSSYALTETVRQAKEHPLTALLNEFRAYISGATPKFPKVATCNFIQLAWRNKTVGKYNSLIFQSINQRTEFATGDIVTNNHAVGLHLKTDAEVEIIAVNTANSLGYAGHVYMVQVASGERVHVFVPNKISDYTRAKNKAIKEGQTKDVQTIMDEWADLRATYASTVNKAQGSTYDKVFIDLTDFKPMVHKDPIQLARLLYVAMSRAKYQVIFTGDLC